MTAMLQYPTIEALQRDLHALISKAACGERPASQIRRVMHLLDEDVLEGLAQREDGYLGIFIAAEYARRLGHYRDDYAVEFMRPGVFRLSAISRKCGLFAISVDLGADVEALAS